MHIATCQRFRCHPFALGAVKMPTGDSWTPEKDSRESVRDREGNIGRKWDELRCHSHLRRVNYVLFIIMRSTHALTTVVSNTNNQADRIDSFGFPFLPSILPLTPSTQDFIFTFVIIHNLFYWLCLLLILLLLHIYSCARLRVFDLLQGIYIFCKRNHQNILYG